MITDHHQQFTFFFVPASSNSSRQHTQNRCDDVSTSVICHTWVSLWYFLQRYFSLRWHLYVIPEKKWYVISFLVISVLPCFSREINARSICRLVKRDPYFDRSFIFLCQICVCLSTFNLNNLHILPINICVAIIKTNVSSKLFQNCDVLWLVTSACVVTDTKCVCSKGI